MLRGKILVSSFYGPLSGPVQTVPRAELMAVVAALRDLVKPTRIHTDHYNLIRDIGRGKRVTCSAKHQNVDLWNMFRDLVEDLCGLDSDLKVVWVKAHLNDGSINSVGN